MTIRQFISENYDDLRAISEKISRKKAVNHKEDSHDLLMVSIEYALVNEQKFANKTPADMRQMLVAIINNKFRWDHGEYVQCTRIDGWDKTPFDNTLQGCRHLQKLIPTYSLQQDNTSFEITPVNEPDHVGNYITELRSQFNDQQIYKLLSIRLAHEKLTYEEQIVFKHYYLDQLTMRQISKLTHIPLSGNPNTIHGIINKVKKKIMILCNQYLNK